MVLFVVVKLLFVRNVVSERAVQLGNGRRVRIFSRMLSYDNALANNESSRVVKVLVKVEWALEGGDLANTTRGLTLLVEEEDRGGWVDRVRVVLCCNGL